MIDLLEAIDPLLLAPLALAALLFAVRSQMLSARARAELHALQHERVDPDTKLLPQTAIPLRLEPELAWAEHDGKPVGIAVFLARGNHPSRASRALRSVMRGEENAYLLGGDRFVVGFWDTDEEGVALAVQRLGQTMEGAGREIVEAGVAMFPRDGRELEDLVQIAEQRLRPLDRQPVPDGRVVHARPDVIRGLGVVARALPGVLLAAVPLGLSYLWFPGSAETSSGPSLGMLLLAPMAAAVFGWNWMRGAFGEPRSAGTERPAWPLALGVLALGTLLVAPTALGGSRTDMVYVAAVTFHLVLVLLVLMETRYLVRAGWVAPALVLAPAAVVLELTYQQMPGTANVARVVVAATLGCLIARAMERIWWVVPVALAISVVDTWSVFGETGTTRQLVETESSVLDLLFFVGPPTSNPLYFLGTTDLVFAVVFFAVSHAWRLPLLRTCLALLVGVAAAFVVVTVTGLGLPVLPFISITFVLAHGQLLLGEMLDVVRPAGVARQRASRPAGTRLPA